MIKSKEAILSFFGVFSQRSVPSIVEQPEPNALAYNDN
jgi:hypothetical protein